MTQTEVADYLGLETNGKGRISDRERGKGQPDADTFLVLCDLYGVGDILAEFKPELRTFPTWDNLNHDESEILTLYRQAEPTTKEAVEPRKKSMHTVTPMEKVENLWKIIVVALKPLGKTV